MPTRSVLTCMMASLTWLLLSSSSCQKNHNVVSDDPAECIGTGPFNPEAGEKLFDMRTAQQLTAAYRKEHPNTQDCYNSRASYFNEKLVDELLKQENAVGLRVYHTYNSEAKTDDLILVAVNASGQDLTSGAPTQETSYFLAQTTMRCPHNCDQESLLYREQKADPASPGTVPRKGL